MMMIKYPGIHFYSLHLIHYVMSYIRKSSRRFRGPTAKNFFFFFSILFLRTQGDGKSLPDDVRSNFL